MKRITKIFAVALMAFAATAQAQMARKVFILETGKGGVEVQVSLPEFVKGPFDFAGNPGIAKVDVSGNGVTVKGQEAMFGSQLAETSIVDYRVSMTKTDSKTDSANNIASTTKFLKKKGLKFTEAQEIETQFPIIPNGDNRTYLICSQPVFEQPKNEIDCTIIESSVTSDKKQSVVMMVTIIEQNVDAYKANPAKYEKAANKMFRDMMSNSMVKRLP